MLFYSNLYNKTKKDTVENSYNRRDTIDNAPLRPCRENIYSLNV